MIKHSKLTSAWCQLTTMLVSSSVEPLYTAVVEQCGTGSGTVAENNRLYLQPLPTPLLQLHVHTHTHNWIRC